MMSPSSLKNTERSKLSSYLASVDLPENFMICFFVILAVGSLKYPIVIVDTPIFAAEAFLFFLYCHISFRQLCFVFLAFSASVFLVPDFKFSPVFLSAIFIIQATTIRLLAVRYKVATVTECVILSYFLVIPLSAIGFYSFHNDASLVSLQIARKVIEALFCIVIFHVIDKTAITLNSFLDYKIPLVPKMLSTKEFVQSLTSVALSSMVIIAVLFELSQVHSSWGASVSSAIDDIQAKHNLLVREKVTETLGAIRHNVEDQLSPDAKEIYSSYGLTDAKIIKLPSLDARESLSEQHYEIVDVLSRLRTISSSFAVTHAGEPSDPRWYFFSSFREAGVMMLSFESKEDLTSFFSTEYLHVSLFDSHSEKEALLKTSNKVGTTRPGSKKFTLFESDNVIVWAESDNYAGDVYFLSALGRGNSLIMFTQESSLSMKGGGWSFITVADAWPFIYSQYLPFITTVVWSFLLLSIFVWLLGRFVRYALKPQIDYTNDYSEYTIALFSSAPNYETPAIRRSMITEAVTAQKTLSTLSTQIKDLNYEMQNTISSYKSFLDEIPVGIMIVDKEGKRDYSNQALARICGLSTVALDEILRIGQEISQEQQGNRSEVEVTCGDGNAHQLHIFTVDRKFTRGVKDGSWVIIADRTEEKIKDEQLAQASKLATLGQMSTEIAHELNQPLNVIAICQASVRTMLASPAFDKEAVMKKTVRIKTAVDRASRIINHMRVYGRVDTGKLELIDAREAIDGALTMTQDQLKILGISVRTETGDARLLVMSDATKLEQVIINLISNSRDAVLENSENPDIFIKASSESGQVKIIVQDNGGGVKEHDLFKIFEPFWTTKLSGEGTGLGGSISYGVIKEMGGSIIADNVDGGLRVTIILKEFRGELELSKASIA
ncbi:MAG: ATP-binding protein [Halioglobus sp.]